ncbi:hypothetical protein [Spirochaeta africana]|uniref:Uncharacterized protein n=1 Tax=Spirochaeta africana (strain ATCC 700263 / DSM 8902 / Z-7692) TaxID=889378 RepID=H9UM14_SPIAZ|nr:hypothetical protein [Spirochaeta africana]AFG38557.1 hypothetical protein Spiaf_2527 [Spirochaeta africana DSM 8902]
MDTAHTAYYEQSRQAQLDTRFSPSVQLSTVVRAQTSSGRVNLPLAQPGMYMRFKYIQGVPARGEGEGYPLYKLRMLDTLIDRLKSMRSDDQMTDALRAPRSEDAVDMMIDNYERQVRAAAMQLDQVGYAVGTGIAETGAVLSSYA